MHRGSFNFSQFINLKDKQQNNPQILWVQPRKVSKKSTMKRNSVHLNNEPKLLNTAIAHIRCVRKRQLSDAIQDMDSFYSSNFALSRQNTPVNYVHKKKNKHKSIPSDLFDIQSENQANRKQQDNELDGLIVLPHYNGLSDLVYSQVMGKQKKINPKLIHAWKDCLHHQDKTQIYGENAQYSFSRVFPVNQLEKGFNQIYGNGKTRCLRIGEQSTLICVMQKYLERCSTQVNKIARKDYDIINTVLQNAKLTNLQNYPMCMKQVELIWKIIATYWRYSGKLDLKNNKQLENALVNGRSNFINLTKQNPVTNFVLIGSNINECRRF